MDTQLMILPGRKNRFFLFLTNIQAYQSFIIYIPTLQPQKMHLCFIIDNSPLTRQPYNYSTPGNNTLTNITILDSIKIGIETSLNDLARSGALAWQFSTFHLFVTSQPEAPISSFEDDRLHFQYQLKEIKSSDQLTNPAETIKFALKHVSKFRMMTGTETLSGYRRNSIYQPAILIFLSYGLTGRSIARIQSQNLENLMRYEYKFVHYRICYPSQSEKDRTFQKYKAETQNSLESKRLQQHAQRMNKGQFRNVIKYKGAQSLSDLFTKFLISYRASLCGQFIFDSQIKMQFPQYFKNSELNLQNFVMNEEQDKFKAQIYKIDDHNNNFTLIPFEAKFSNKNGVFYIEQIKNLQFFVDISKKLTGAISNEVPFFNYAFVNTPPRLLKLEKELERLGVSQILFPVYFSTTSSGQKGYYLCGFLRFCIEPRVETLFEVIISYPNFLLIESIINLAKNQKSYADGRKIEKLLIDYHSNIPKFYHKFLGQYFGLLATRIPPLSIYHKIAANNWNRPQTSQLKPSMQDQLQEQELKQKQRLINEDLNMLKEKKINEKKHLQGQAACCPAYGTSEAFNLYSKNISKQTVKKNGLEAAMQDIFEKVNEFALQKGLNSYFSGRDKQKSGPMAKQLSKYNPRINDSQLLSNPDIFSFSQANQSIHPVPPSQSPTKKLRQQIAQQQHEVQQLTQMIEMEMDSEQNGNKIDVNDIQMMPNSVAVESLKNNIVNLEETEHFLKVERELMINKIEIQKGMLENKGQKMLEENKKDPRLQNYNISKNSIVQHIKNLKIENPIKLKINSRNLCLQKFEQNMKKLSQIGFFLKQSPSIEDLQQ